MRRVLIVVASLAFAATLVADWTLRFAALAPTIGAGIVLVALLFENRRYKRVLDVAPGPDWQETEERFVDPETGQTVTVFFNAATGERRYVATDKR